MHSSPDLFGRREAPEDAVVAPRRARRCVGDVHQVDTNAAGTVIYDNQLTYDSKGRIATQQTTQLQKSVYYGTTGTYTTTVTNSYGDGTADYALGAITSSTTSGFAIENGVYRTMPVSSTVNSYAWYEGAVQSSVVYTPDTGQPGTSFTTSYYYSGSGVFTSAIVADGQPRTITVKSDVLGQVIRRDESKNSGNNSTYDSSYAGSLVDRERTPFSGTSTGSFRFGATAGASFGDFNTRLTPVNSFQQGSSGGSYTVRTGDTLSSVAAQVWGDASLWYKIAEANGLNAASTLVEGQTLTLPGGVSKNGNSSSTFKPYDPSDAYGDTSPTTPKPQAANKNKCGVFGQILMLAVAVAITAVLKAPVTNFFTGLFAGPTAVAAAAAVGTTVAVTGATAVAAGAAAGAALGIAASVGSQLFGMATGIQQGGFNWKAVALAGITGAVGGAFNTPLSQGGGSIFGKLGLGGAGWAAQATRAGVAAGVSGGIGAALGVAKFDFAGVAAAAVGAGLSSQIKLAGPLGSITRNAADGIAEAATRSVITGTSFGDNIIAVLPNVISNTIGGFIAERVAGSGLSKSTSSDAQKRSGDASEGGSETARSDATITLTPEANILFKEISGEISSEIANALRMNVASLKEQLRSDYMAGVQVENSAGLGSDGLPYMKTMAVDYAIDLDVVDYRKSTFMDAYKAQNGAVSADSLKNFLISDQQNRDLIKKWDAVADHEINKFLFLSVGAPALLAAGAVAAPVVAGYAGSFYVGGSAAGTLASGGAGFVTGGTFGVGFEFTKNRAFGLPNTTGGYTSAFIGGGLGGTGLRLLPMRYLAGSLGQAANRGLVGAFSGFSGELSGQLVTSGGNFGQLDTSQLLLQGGIGGALGAALPDVRWNGVTAGRNNSVAIYTGLQTRMNSGNIGRFQVGYAASAGAANAVKGVYAQGAGAAVDGVIKRATGR